MRGSDTQDGSDFSYVNLEERVPPRHPLRKIKALVDAALASLDDDFDRLYAGEGRPSIAPERQLQASLVQILFSVKSERQLMQRCRNTCCCAGSCRQHAAGISSLSIDDTVWVQNGILEGPRPPVENGNLAQRPRRETGATAMSRRCCRPTEFPNPA